MKYLLVSGVLLLVCAVTLSAFTNTEEPDSSYHGYIFRQQPAAPINPSIVRSGNTITLDWDDVTEDIDGNPIDVSSYKVYYGEVLDFEGNPSNLIETVSVSGLVLEDWSGDVDLAFFKVVAVGEEYDPLENFVLVPGGTFSMGDSRGQGSSYELPTHSVTLNPFYISKYELTQAEFEEIMGYNPGAIAPQYGFGDDNVVYSVSWYHAIKYCNLRSIEEGLTPCYTIDGTTDPSFWGAVPSSHNPLWNAAICDFGADGYRLPTEAEWEYAARAATNTPDYLYSGSEDVDAVAWYYSNSNFSSQVVGTKDPNGLGLYDMSGNVYEWCWDWFSSSYYSVSPTANPTGPSSGSERMIRGGCWDATAYTCRVTHRYNIYPYNTYPDVGFRICRSGL